MAKTYTAVPTVTAGDVYTASAYNTYTSTNVSNLIVPPMAQIALSANVAVANNSHTDFAGFTSTNATEEFDTDDMVTLSGTASAITIQTAGVYQVSATAVIAANATGFRLARIVRSRSGTLVGFGTSVSNSNSATSAAQLNMSGLVACQAGDLIRLMVFQGSGGSLNLIPNDTGAEFGRTMISAIWVGRTS